MSSEHNTSTGIGAILPLLLWLSRALALAAFGLACHLASISLGSSAALGCGPAAGCREVLGSAWAYWLGVPVSLIGAVLYVAVLLASFGSRPPDSWVRPAGVWVMILPVALCILGAAGWFFLLQLAVIHRFCHLCSLTHLSGVLAVTLLLWHCHLRRQTPASLPAAQPVDRRAVHFGWAMLGAAASMAVLIAGQVFYPKQTHSVRGLARSLILGGGEPGKPEVVLFDQKFMLDLNRLPMVGSSQAQHAIVNLFDYTCFACRVLHVQLTQAQLRFTNQFSILYLPVPLDGRCNPLVTEVYPAHTNGCQYARIALAVWGADRSQYAAFDHWIFATPYAPSLDQTVEFAARLVGRGPLEKQLGDKWIDEQIQRNVQIYGISFRHFGNHSLPQLIIGTNLTTGTFSRIEVLDSLLAGQLGASR